MECNEIDNPKTDWDFYYRNPAPTAKFTRKFTEILILKCFNRYINKTPSFIELGGAMSSYFSAIRKAYPQSPYAIVDNNQFGLDAFKNTYPNENNVSLHNADIKHPLALSSSDITFSVGLIEHFDPAGTAQVIARHFEITRPGGLVLITFPTPTRLYLFARKFLEWFGLWMFPDERPLGFDEVRKTVLIYGEILYENVNWPTVLTQGVMVIRKTKS